MLDAMRTTLNEPMAGTDPDGNPEVEVCACGHEWSSHDAIATRFCRASHARALKRACVCPDKPAPPKRDAPMYGYGKVHS
jgi:hypothetical protein